MWAKSFTPEWRFYPGGCYHFPTRTVTVHFAFTCLLSTTIAKYLQISHEKMIGDVLVFVSVWTGLFHFGFCEQTKGVLQWWEEACLAVQHQLVTWYCGVGCWFQGPLSDRGHKICGAYLDWSRLGPDIFSCTPANEQSSSGSASIPEAETFQSHWMQTHSLHYIATNLLRFNLPQAKVLHGEEFHLAYKPV